LKVTISIEKKKRYLFFPLLCFVWGVFCCRAKGRRKRIYSSIA
jgi:hypothetical protein